jgi:hypothetical protein
MPSRLAPYVIGLALAVCAVLALVGFGADQPGQVAGLLLGMVVAAAGFFLRKRPEPVPPRQRSEA